MPTIRASCSMAARSRMLLRSRRQEKEGCAEGRAEQRFGLCGRIEQPGIEHRRDGHPLVGEIRDQNQLRTVTELPFDQYNLGPEHPVVAGKRRDAGEARHDLARPDSEQPAVSAKRAQMIFSAQLRPVEPRLRERCKRSRVWKLLARRLASELREMGEFLAPSRAHRIGETRLEIAKECERPEA